MFLEEFRRTPTALKGRNILAPQLTHATVAGRRFQQYVTLYISIKFRHAGNQRRVVISPLVLKLGFTKPLFVPHTKENLGDL